MTEDRLLIARAVRGEPDALDALAALHRPGVVRTATHVLGDRDLADDVAQDVFLRMQAHLPDFRGDAELSTWLHRITVNRCLDQLRAQHRQPNIPLWDRLDHPALHLDADSPETIERQQVQAAVHKAIARLPPEQRIAVTLRYLRGCSYEEIAEATNTPVGTVASRVYRALRRLGQDAALQEEIT